METSPCPCPRRDRRPARDSRDNPFKIRAYRNASQVVRDCGERVAASPLPTCAACPDRQGIATHVTELVETGGSTFHRELAAEFPAGLLDVLRLQGVGPKTTALPTGNFASARWTSSSRRSTPGGSRRQGDGTGEGSGAAQSDRGSPGVAGRYLASEVWQQAHAMISHLRTVCPDATFDLVGSLRRGAETCGDLDVLATGAGPEVMEHFVAFGRVERVLGQGRPRAASVSPRACKPISAGPPASRRAALQYFTGARPTTSASRSRDRADSS